MIYTYRSPLDRDCGVAKIKKSVHYMQLHGTRCVPRFRSASMFELERRSEGVHARVITSRWTLPVSSTRIRSYTMCLRAKGTRSLFPFGRFSNTIHYVLQAFRVGDLGRTALGATRPDSTRAP